MESLVLTKYNKMKLELKTQQFQKFELIFLTIAGEKCTGSKNKKCKAEVY